MPRSVRDAIAEGRVALPRIGEVTDGPGAWLPYVLLDADGGEVSVVSTYLRALMVGDASPLTCKSYANDLLRWFRLLWMIKVPWQQATEGEVALLVSWMRNAENPQRRRQRTDSPAAGTVNLKTGKPSLERGYAKSTINHCMTGISNFYAHHARYGEGPVSNPVPENKARRRALGHRSPIDARKPFRRAPMRQKIPVKAPRSIPDEQWDELFGAMTNNRDRALMAFYVSSGGRASEVLEIRPGDVDWAKQRIYVVSKGTRLREPIPASPEAFHYLALYLDEYGMPEADGPVWRALRGDPRPLTYSALRRSLQRANGKLGTNWTLHDTRHTAAQRMNDSDKLSLTEVQTVLRHSELSTTGRYLQPRMDELVGKMTEFYAMPRETATTFAPGYDPEDVKAVFGG